MMRSHDLVASDKYVLFIVQKLCFDFIRRGKRFQAVKVYLFRFIKVVPEMQFTFRYDLLNLIINFTYIKIKQYIERYFKKSRNNRYLR
ncbi:hypothetical protein SDC9_129464 [bioreactor metagenome]|uniref:Uncharacterized protein n=1 Tax=bioreactor metagenome TaxID=1076179 RepID=A0A645CZW5_9ZZZZ